jgi:hypothetical protein
MEAFAILGLLASLRLPETYGRQGVA